MSLGRLVVAAVTIEGRPKAAVAREYGISRGWVHELIRRYEAEGESGLEPRSRRPRSSPQRIPPWVEDDIVELRKTLADQGLDAGAHTIAFHLTRRHGASPAVSTIWRILSRRGSVRHPPAAEAPPVILRPVRGLPAQRTVAGGHDPLDARRR